MKTLIVLVLGLLSVGCLTPEQKQKRLRDSVVGEYEFKSGDGVTYKDVYLENGILRRTMDAGIPRAEVRPISNSSEWSIVDGEIHIEYGSGYIGVMKINPDKSINMIATIFDGKRTDTPKEKQSTFKKIK